MSQVKSETAAPYHATLTVEPIADLDRLNEDDIIEEALSILFNRMATVGESINSTRTTANYLNLKMGNLEHEEFAILFLNTKHQVLAFDSMFRGTIDGASVHTREVVKAALAHNAAAVIFAHNHPSGNTEPSSADRQITTRLKDALALVDVRVLDHIIVGGDTTTSFAERGLM